MSFMLYKVEIGGLKGCMYFSVYKDADAPYPNLDALLHANGMNSVGYHTYCNVTGDFEPKEGTILPEGRDLPPPIIQKGGRAFDLKDFNRLFTGNKKMLSGQSRPGRKIETFLRQMDT